MPVAIRPLVPDDIARIQAIEHDAAARFRAVGLDAVADGDVSSSAFIGAILVQGVALGASTPDDCLVGFALAGLLDGALHVYELSVALAFGERGIGGSLVEALGERAHGLGLGALTLATFADVPWNAPFYRRRGFVDVDFEDWSPGFHVLRAAERSSGLPLDRRIFMRKEIS